MYQYDFARPSVTATVLPILKLDDQNAWVLWGVRGNVKAYPGHLCLPGGFLNPRVDLKDAIGAQRKVEAGETVEETAVRELHEETNIVIDVRDLTLFHVSSHPLTDPRAHVVNICYFTLLTRRHAEMMKAGDDIARLEWLPMDYPRGVVAKPERYAFDHLRLSEIGRDYFQRFGF